MSKPEQELINSSFLCSCQTAELHARNVNKQTSAKQTCRRLQEHVPTSKMSTQTCKSSHHFRWESLLFRAFVRNDRKKGWDGIAGIVAQKQKRDRLFRDIIQKHSLRGYIQSTVFFTLFSNSTLGITKQQELSVADRCGRMKRGSAGGSGRRRAKH